MADPHSTEIEEILAGPPSCFAFDLLCALIDATPDPGDRGRAVDKAWKALDRWPAWTRHMAITGCKAAGSLLRRPSWPLVRSLYWTAVDGLGTSNIDRVTADLASDPNAARLRRLELDLPVDVVLPGLRLATRFPNLRRFSIDLGCDNRRETLLRLLATDLPTRLRSLTLKGVDNVDDHAHRDALDVVDAIASSPVGPRLRIVRLPYASGPTYAHFLDRFNRPMTDIGHQTWTYDAIERLCRSEDLASGLRRLNFHGSSLGRDGVELLAGCPHLGRLERLDLAANDLGPEEAAVLADSPFASNLTGLNLFSNPLGDEGWEALARGPFRRLRSLNLCWTDCATAHGARSLARSRSLRGLRSLQLDCNGIGDEGASEILHAPFARGLRLLGLAWLGKTTATADLLARRPLARLRTLDLGGDGPGPEFGRRLAQFKAYPSLARLKLRGLKLGDEGAAHLAESTAFPRLRKLDLNDNDLTDAGVRTLVASPFVAPIRELHLRSNDVSDDAFAALAESPYISNLIGLGFYLERLGRETRGLLRKSPGTRLLPIPDDGPSG